MSLQLSASLNLTGSINLSGSFTSTQTMTITSSISVNSLTASYFGSGSDNYFPFWSSNKLSFNSLISQSNNQITILSDTASFLGDDLIINKSDPIYVNNNPTIDVSNSPNQTLMLTPNIVLGGDGNGEHWNRFNSNGTVDFLGANIKFTSGGAAAFNSNITIGSPILLGNNKLDVIGNISASSITASRLLGTADTASYYGGSVTSASYSLSSSFAPTNTNITASWSTNSLTASNLVTTNNYTVNNINSNGTGSFSIIGIGSSSPSAKLDIRQTSANTGLKVFTNDTSTAYIAQFIGYDNSLGDTTRMVVQAGGNVGIGTTSPASQGGFNKVVDLYDATSIDLQVNVANTYKADFGISANGGWLGTITAHAMRFVSSGTERMRITSDGNVGIGTTSPGAKLDVSGGSYNTGIIIRSNDTLGSGVGLINSDTGGKTWYIISTASSNTGGAGHLGFFNATDNFYRLYIKSDGNVGLGTTSPTQRLQLGDFTSTSTATPETINFGATYSNTAGANLKLRIYDDNNGVVGGMGVSNGQVEVNTWATGKIAFYRGTTQSAIIDANGNVGVGTTSTAYKLDVLGDLRISGSTSTIGTFKSSANNCFISLIDSSGDNVFLGNDDGDFLIQTPTSAYSTKLIVKDDGNVGIGTTSPASKLSIAGSSATNFKSLILRNGDGTVGSTVSIDLETSAGTIGDEAAMAARISGIRLGGGTTGGLIFSTTDNGNLGERVRILNNGAVGIGTTSPSLISGYIGLNVLNAGYTQIKLQSNASSAGIEFKPSSGNSWELQANNSNQWFVFDRTQELYRLLINNSGSVGIGTTSPLTKLNLSGGSGAVYQTFTDTTNAYHHGYIGKNGDGLVFGFSSENGSFSADEKMRIDTTGNVGIGTTSPVYKLDLQPTSSTARLGNAIIGAWPVNTTFALFGHNNLDHTTSATNYALIQWNDGTTYLNASSGKNINFRIANSDKMILDSSGKIGIGTTAPITGYLDVRSSVSKTSTATNIAFFGSSDGTGPLGLAINHESSSGIKMVGLVGTEYGVSGNNIKINETVTVQYSGNVGIGTTSPDAKLQVNGEVRIVSSTSYFTHLNYLDGGSNLISSTNDGSTLFRGSSNNLTSMIVYGNGTVSTNYNTYLAVTNGNVGIGTTSPASKLEVYSTSSVNTSNYYGLSKYNASLTSNVLNGQVGILFSALSNSGLPANASIHTVPISDYRSGMVSTYSADAFGAGYFYVNQFIPVSSATVTRFAINNDGNIGIGTTSPIAKLHVSYGNDSQSVKMIGGSGSTNGNFIYSLATDYSDTFGLNVFATAHTNAARTNNLVRIHSNETSNGSLPLRVTTQGTIASPTYEALSVNYLGNVGIGTTAPAAKLHVAGLVTLDSTIVYSKVNSITTNNPIRIIVPFTKINTGADFIVKVKAIAMANNSSGVNYLDYVGYSGYTFNFNANLTTIEKLGNVVVNSYVSASSGTAGNLYIELNGDDGYLQDSNWTIQTDILGNSMYSTFDSGSITTIATSISEDSLETSFNKYFGGNVGIGTTSFVYSNAARGDIEVYGSTDALISLRNATANSYLQKTGNDFYFNNGGAGFISITTNASERMRITSDGNVGIGTSNPTGTYGKLSVAGGIRILDDNNAKLEIGRYSSGASNSYIKLGSNSNALVITNAADSVDIFAITNSGNVGIGTTSPTNKLHIGLSNAVHTNEGIYFESPSGYGGAGLYHDYSLSGPLTNFKLVNTYSDSRINLAQDSYNPGGSPGHIGFFTQASGGGGTATERMRILSDGNVGIGTTVPAAKLHVSGGDGILTSAPDSFISIQSTSTTGSAYLQFLNSSDAGVGAIYYGFTNNDLTFKVNSSTRMYISSSGNVGIGTTSPLERITFGSSDSIIARSSATTFNSGYCSRILFNQGGTGYGYLGFYTYEGGSGGGERMRIAENGYVGIGTTSPAGKLHIVQNNDVGRYSYFGSNSGLFIKANDNSINNLLVLENTEPAANYGVSINFNLGYGGNQTTAGTAIQGSKIVAAQEQTWTSTSSTQDAFLAFYTALNGTSGEKVRITSDGNVGIGTTSPSQKLSVNNGSTGGSGAVYPIRLSGGTMSSANDATGIQFIQRDTFNDYGGYIRLLNTQGNPFYLNPRLEFGVQDTETNVLGSVTTKMVITGDGNVGIGTTSAAAKLHVNGSTTIVGDTATTQNVRQTIVGSTTGNASTTAKKIFVCGHTSTGTITVTAIITSVDTASATATFSFANAFGNSVTPNRLSYISLNSTITSIDCSYNNSGYQMEIAVTYTGATAPTLYFTAEGMGSSIWTL